jgi:ribosomal protein L37AE/L43A
MTYANNEVSAIEIPFEHRHHCWFCGEPSQVNFCFPSNYSDNVDHNQHRVVNASHPRLNVPCCAECYRLASEVEADSIWAVKEAVKRRLLHLYRKDLAIGLNWTQEELANSEFEGGCFAGFQKSAWFIYEVAKARVSFNGWPIVYQGIDLDIAIDEQTFVFDGVTYPNVEDAVSHYCQVFSLNKTLFQKALNKVGIEGFAKVIRFCRLLVGATPNEQKQSLKEFI